MPLPTETELATDLLAAADARARQHRLRINPDARSSLQALAATGAQRILAAAEIKPADEQDSFLRAAVRVASEGLAAFTDEMTSARISIPGYAFSHPDSMGEETFAQAFRILCPLWPFCP